MPKNITYHQTGAQKARRSRNDSASIGGLGLAGMAATPGKTGLTVPLKVGLQGAKVNHAMGNGGIKGIPAAAKAGAEFAHRSGALKAVHPGRGLAEAAVATGAAGVVAGEARNIYHTRKEQKLRRNRGVSKAMKSYCKKHECFDDCKAMVSKIMDDGIRHLTSVERVKTSPETRVRGTLQPLVVGNRQLDGTPRTGSAPGASKVHGKTGKSGPRTRVGSSGIREVSKADQSDPFEISKAYDPNKSPVEQGYGFQTGGGARKRTIKTANRESALISPRGTNRKANWKQLGSSMGKGTAGGGAAGAAIGAAAGLKGKKSAPSAVGGAIVGAGFGALAGETHGLGRIHDRANKKAWASGVKSGDIRKPGKDERVNAFGSIKPVSKAAPTARDKKAAEAVPPEVAAYIAAKKQDMSKSADPFEVSKGFGAELGAIRGAAKVMVNGGAHKGPSKAGKFVAKNPVKTAAAAGVGGFGLGKLGQK